MGELVVKTCFFDTSLFRNIKWVIFALSWSFYSMWMKVEGGQNNQAELIWSEYTGTVNSLRGRKKVFFQLYCRLADVLQVSHGILLSPFPSYSVVPVWEKEKEREMKCDIGASAAAEAVSHMLGKRTVCQLGSRRHKHRVQKRLKVKHSGILFMSTLQLQTLFCCLLWW